jgi:multiple sugar transport system permease protein
MTGGGPSNATTNLFYLAYEMAFESFNIGFASATALLLFVGLGALAALKAWLLGRRVHYA